MNQDGHLPEGAVFATAEMLRQANTKLVRLQGQSAEQGREVFARIRRVDAVDYALTASPIPPELLAAPAEEQVRWYEALPVRERRERDLARALGRRRFVALGVVEPRLTEEDAANLGPDLSVLYNEIMVFSGLAAVPAPAPEASAAASPAIQEPAPAP